MHTTTASVATVLAALMLLMQDAVKSEFVFQGCQAKSNINTVYNQGNARNEFDLDLLVDGFCWEEKFQDYNSTFYQIDFADDTSSGLGDAFVEVRPVTQRGGCLWEANGQPRLSLYDVDDQIDCIKQDIRLSSDGSKVITLLFTGVTSVYCLTRTQADAIIAQALEFEGQSCEGTTLSATTDEVSDLPKVEPFGSFVLLGPSTGGYENTCQESNCYFEGLLTTFSKLKVYWTGVTRRTENAPLSQKLENGQISLVVRPSNEITPAGEYLIADYGTMKLFTAGTGGLNFVLSEEEVAQAVADWPFPALEDLAAAVGSIGMSRYVDIPRMNSTFFPCTIFPDGSCRQKPNPTPPVGSNIPDEPVDTPVDTGGPVDFNTDADSSFVLVTSFVGGMTCALISLLL